MKGFVTFQLILFSVLFLGTSSEIVTSCNRAFVQSWRNEEAHESTTARIHDFIRAVGFSPRAVYCQPQYDIRSGSVSHLRLAKDPESVVGTRRGAMLCAPTER